MLGLWEEHDVFRRSVENADNEKPYIFYDGPPFATGLPHHGNLVGSVLKDIVPRYWTMKGYRVERRFGWDCHGLPIEQEIDKTPWHVGGGGGGEDRRRWLQRPSVAPSSNAMSPSGARPSRVSAAGWTSTTTTRPWTPGTWSPCGGWSKSSGTRG